MPAMLYDLTVSDRLPSREGGRRGLPALEFVSLRELAAGPAAGFDMLTWVEAPWRHQGIGTAMKYHAVQNARRAGITALWAAGDARSVAFFEPVMPRRGRPARACTAGPT